MKTRHICTNLGTSLLLLATVLNTSSLIAQAPGTTSPNPSDLPARPANEAHPSAEDECTTAANNGGQGAVENAQSSNPNAPVDLQGSRGQTNPSTERAESAQIAQSEDNCVDTHEGPSTNENTREQNSPNTDGQGANSDVRPEQNRD